MIFIIMILKTISLIVTRNNLVRKQEKQYLQDLMNDYYNSYELILKRKRPANFFILNDTIYSINHLGQLHKLDGPAVKGLMFHRWWVNGSNVTNANDLIILIINYKNNY